MRPVILGLVVLASAATAFAQTPAQGRIPQQIVINGQPANGVHVLNASGGIQNFTCGSPQAYSTPDGATSGWACLEPTTGSWLMGSLPPQTASQPIHVPQPVIPQPPTIIYAAPPQQVIYQQPAVIYAAPPQQVIYQQPAVVYAVPRQRTVVVNSYPSNAIVQAATINAVGRVAAAAISRPPRTIHVIETRGGGGGRRR